MKTRSIIAALFVSTFLFSCEKTEFVELYNEIDAKAEEAKVDPEETTAPLPLSGTPSNGVQTVEPSGNPTGSGIKEVSDGDDEADKGDDSKKRS